MLQEKSILFLTIYLFACARSLVAARGILSLQVSMPDHLGVVWELLVAAHKIFSCGMWELIP